MIKVDCQAKYHDQCQIAKQKEYQIELIPLFINKSLRVLLHNDHRTVEHH